ncbi:MAG TPA: PIN domain-containing protein [Rhizomicrobium sp.]|nr:PIN domain-containing protein [Rhizomicrobium sp.]
MISLDANILVYAADLDAGERHARAQDVVRRASNSYAGLTEQSLFEFFHASTRKSKMSYAEAAVTMRDLLQSFVLLLPPQTIVEDTLALRDRNNLSVWDSRLLAVCAAHGCGHLLSEDLQDGAQYGGVTVVNPFNPANARLIGRLLS